MEAIARAITKRVSYGDLTPDDQRLLVDKYVDIILRFVTKQLAVETRLPVLPTGRDTATIVGDLRGPEIFTDQNRWQPIFCKGCTAEVYNSQVAHPQPVTSISQIYCCSLCDITDGQCHEVGCGNTCLNQRTCRGPHHPLYALLVQQHIIPTGYPDELMTCDAQRLHLSKSLADGRTTGTHSLQVVYDSFLTITGSVSKAMSVLVRRHAARRFNSDHGMYCALRLCSGTHVRVPMHERSSQRRSPQPIARLQTRTLCVEMCCTRVRCRL